MTRRRQVVRTRSSRTHPSANPLRARGHLPKPHPESPSHSSAANLWPAGRLSPVLAWGSGEFEMESKATMRRGRNGETPALGSGGTSGTPDGARGRSRTQEQSGRSTLPAAGLRRLQYEHGRRHRHEPERPLRRVGLAARPQQRHVHHDRGDIVLLTRNFSKSMPPAPARQNMAPEPPDTYIDIFDITRALGFRLGPRCAS